MLTAFALLLGLAAGFIVGSWVTTRGMRVMVDAADARTREAEERARAAIAEERGDSQGRIRQSFDMVSVLVGEARQAITQSRLMMTDAVDITKQATGLLLPVKMDPDDEGPLSIADADRQRAKMQRMGADVEDKRGRA